MDGVAMWMLVGFGALLLAALLVAWAEQLTLQDQLRQPQPPPIEAIARTVAVDVHLDAWADAAPVEAAAMAQGQADLTARREVLDGALVRMAQRGVHRVTDSLQGWIDTTPMVGPGARADPEPATAGQPARHAAPTSLR